MPNPWALAQAKRSPREKFGLKPLRSIPDLAATSIPT